MTVLSELTSLYFAVESTLRSRRRTDTRRRSENENGLRAAFLLHTKKRGGKKKVRLRQINGHCTDRRITFTDPAFFGVSLPAVLSSVADCQLQKWRHPLLCWWFSRCRYTPRCRSRTTKRLLRRLSPRLQLLHYPSICYHRQRKSSPPCNSELVTLCFSPFVWLLD